MTRIGGMDRHRCPVCRRWRGVRLSGSMSQRGPHENRCPGSGRPAPDAPPHKGHAGRKIEKRLYECPNGLALAARRGGPLHLADGATWEVCTMDEHRVVVGESIGWVDEATIERLVRRLAVWGAS